MTYVFVDMFDMREEAELELVCRLDEPATAGWMAESEVEGGICGAAYAPYSAIEERL